MDAQERGALRYQVTTRRLMDTCTLVQMGTSLQNALSNAVIDAIDSPIESRTAAQLLREFASNMEVAKQRWDAAHPTKAIPIEKAFVPEIDETGVPF